MSGVIHRKDLDRVMFWLTQVLDLGPGLGDVFFVATSGSAYETWLKKIGVSSDHLFTTIASGYAAMTTERNDVLCVAPGNYAQTVEIDWAKSHSHLVGLGGPPLHSEWSIPNVSIYTATITVAQVIDLTGHYCQFRNLSINNYGADAACLAALNVNGYGNSFKFVDIIGAMTSAQIAVVAASSLYIGANGANCLYEDCNIGSNAWATRTVANSGVIRFTGTAGGGGPSNSILRRCTINSRAETATIAMVALPANNCIARGWLFDRCYFNNMWTNNATQLNQAFYDNCGTTHYINLIGCSSFGIAKWTSSTSAYISSSDGAGSATGGIGIATA